MTRIISVQANWDLEAHVWVAVCDELSIVTEAATVDALRERLRLIVADVLEGEGQATQGVVIALDAHVADPLNLQAA